MEDLWQCLQHHFKSKSSFPSCNRCFVAKGIYVEMPIYKQLYFSTDIVEDRCVTPVIDVYSYVLAHKQLTRGKEK